MTEGPESAAFRKGPVPDISRMVDAVWRSESAAVIATLTRLTGDVAFAEDLAQEAVLAALEQWPESGVPQRAGAWLTTVAKRKAIDGWRRRERLDERHHALARELTEVPEVEWQPIPDDVLRLVFLTCHPVLGREAQVALTLRLVGGLTTAEIARMLLSPVPTVQQRIVRAKRTLSAANIRFEAPDPAEWSARLGSVLGVLYLIFTEGYAATSGNRWMRPDLADEALRLGRVLARLTPREPEVHGLVALMEFQRSRFAARVDRDGSPVLLADQDRTRWDHAQIARGRAALRVSDEIGRGRGNYALQAAIAECHSVAPSVASTDWDRIVLLYEILGRIAPNPIVELNRAVAVSMASGPAAALEIVETVASDKRLQGSPQLASVRGELLSQLGRTAEARGDLLRAAELTGNERQRDVLLAKADALPRGK